MSKVVLITGCSSGFGFVTAKYLLERGYTVIPTVRKKADLPLLPNSVQLDVTWEQAKINQVINDVIEKHGHLDVLVNNAGYGHLGRVEDFNGDAIRAQMETNFIGAFKMIKAVLPQMKEQKEGLIINVSSILGLFAIPEYGIYAASKHALEALSQAFRLESQKDHLKVVVVNPGAFKTRFYANSKDLSKEKFASEDYGPDPILVALLIERIINTKNPRPNYLIGKEAMTIRLLLKFPSLFREFILKRYFT